MTVPVGYTGKNFNEGKRAELFLELCYVSVEVCTGPGGAAQIVFGSSTWFA